MGIVAVKGVQHRGRLRPTVKLKELDQTHGLGYQGQSRTVRISRSGRGGTCAGRANLTGRAIEHSFFDRFRVEPRAATESPCE